MHPGAKTDIGPQKAQFAGDTLFAFAYTRLVPEREQSCDRERAEYSMNKKSVSARNGLLCGGNWIIDQVKLIDVYPQREQLANIRSQSQGTGGAPYNVAIDLAKLGVSFPIMAAGLVGKDALGQTIIDDCQRHNIDTKYLRQTTAAPTSYTDVMTEIGGGNRTFFHMRGANALWTGADLDFARIKARMFHLGYLLLLDELDKPDKTYGTKAAALLARAQSAGIKTSVDVVSEDSDRFNRIVTPALKYVDYCILNEIEAGKTTGFRIRQADGSLDTVSLRHAAGAMLQLGVKELVVIHFPEGGFARTRKGDDHWQPSLNLPPKYIAGMAGAGDAFCAGVLIGLHEGWELKRCLEAGVCVAAASLSAPTCTDGVKRLKTVLELPRKYRYRAPLEAGD
ncbi:MAG: putative sugar kinase YdjH [Verrucomicrobia bacterium ADurb.Bin006]|jgi:sugar/nucleoside kinase (ribokinase family)|nr:MAG: putative sugar kinase YdjH [Verrucomicrobia bacterium ADurb.Bin006]